MSVVASRPPILRYTRTAMLLHWVVAVLIGFNVILGLVADHVPDGSVRAVIDLHKSTGITVLGLVILRILWRLSHKPPPMPATYPPLERFAAHAAHLVFYALILLLPISGWMHDSAWKGAAANPMTLYGLIPWPRIGWIQALDPARKEELHTAFFKVHAYAAYVLYALLALHVLGALKHQFWDREGELQRMLPGR